MFAVIVLALPVALAFMALSGQVTLAGFIVGYPLSLAALWLGQAYNLQFKPTRILSQVLFLLWYAARLALDIFWSSVEVARMVLAPDIDSQIKPGVVTVETQDPDNNDIVTAMSAHGITITPGQLVVDIDKTDDGTIMYVHNLNIDQAQDIDDDQTKRLRLIRRILGYD